MNATPHYDNPQRNLYNRKGSAIAKESETSPDDEMCSLTIEPSLTNSSFSFNSSSTSSDCDRPSYARSLSSPLPSRLPLVSTHSSLLDIERDESLTSPEDEDDNDISDYDVQYHTMGLEPEATSFMEQTENNLANISETLSGSFCNPGEVNNSCHLSDCCLSKGKNDERSSTHSYSDLLARKRLMEDFNYILGKDASPCCEEREVFCHLFSSWSNDARFEKELPENRDNQIRNRAGESWRARAYRIKRLRESRNACPAPNAWDSDQNHGIRQSYSLDGKGLERKMTRFESSYQTKRHDAIKFKPKHEINSDPLRCIIGDCIEPILNIEGEENELEVVLKQQDQNDVLFGEDLCYDSDPGESLSRHSGIINSVQHDTERNCMRSNGPHVEGGDMTFKKAPSKSPTKRRRRMYFDSILENNDNDESHSSFIENRNKSCDTHYSDCRSQEIENSSCDQTYVADKDIFWGWSHAKSSTISRKELDVIRNIQNALNRTYTLTWHPTSDDFPQESTKSNSNSFRSPLRTIQNDKKKVSTVTAMPPRCIQLWFERGNRIRGNDIVEPKLMWREAYHPELASHRKLNVSAAKGPHQVCLLGICRILEASSAIDRKKYPFAKISCSFIIRTCDDMEYVFEAKSEKIRAQILQQWKMLVARLASQAVVGDGEGMVGEFFVPNSFAVP